MKLALLLFLTAITTHAGSGVYCQLKDSSICKDCGARVPVSCEDHKFNGSIDLKTKPQKIHWLISNSANGSDRILETDNNGMDLQALLNPKNFAPLLKKQKISLEKTEKISLAGINIGVETALYKNQSDTAIAGKFQLSPSRSVASETPTYQIGGIRRAQKKINKETK